MNIINELESEVRSYCRDWPAVFRSAKGCCLVGHPGYYRQFGFSNPSGLALEGVPPEVFFALAFDGHHPQGTVTFHEGFKAEGSHLDGLLPK